MAVEAGLENVGMVGDLPGCGRASAGAASGWSWMGPGLAGPGKGWVWRVPDLAAVGTGGLGVAAGFDGDTDGVCIGLKGG